MALWWGTILCPLPLLPHLALTVHAFHVSAQRMTAARGSPQLQSLPAVKERVQGIGHMHAAGLDPPCAPSPLCRAAHPHDGLHVQPAFLQQPRLAASLCVGAARPPLGEPGCGLAGLGLAWKRFQLARFSPNSDHSDQLPLPSPLHPCRSCHSWPPPAPRPSMTPPWTAACL